MRRLRILATASEAFLERGYNGVSTDDLVTLAGGSKSSIYRYFGSKAGLFMAVVDYLCERFIEHLPTDGGTGETPQAKLESILHELVSVAASRRHLAFYRMIVEGQAHVPGVGQVWYEQGPLVWRRRLNDVLAAMPGIDPAQIPRLAEVLFDAVFCRLTIRTAMLDQIEPDVDDVAVIRLLVETVGRYSLPV